MPIHRQEAAVRALDVVTVHFEPAQPPGCEAREPVAHSAEETSWP
jgi:hypothetical protein